MQLTSRDKIKVNYLLGLASDHSPGGKYGMVAGWVKGKRLIIGYNNTDRPAATAVDGYPVSCGIHAELDIFLQARDTDTEIRGGTMYVVGRKRTNNKVMSNTSPCIYCKTILSSTKVRAVVFFRNGILQKTSSEELWQMKRI